MFRKLNSKFAEGANVGAERLVAPAALAAIIEEQCPRGPGKENAALRGGVDEH